MPLVFAAGNFHAATTTHFLHGRSVAATTTATTTTTSDPCTKRVHKSFAVVAVVVANGSEPFLMNLILMALNHLQPPRGLSVVVAVLAARRARELAPGIPWWLLWRFRRSPGRAGRLLWGFLGPGAPVAARRRARVRFPQPDSRGWFCLRRQTTKIFEQNINRPKSRLAVRG